MIASLLIFAGIYLVLSIGRMPGFRVDRTGAISFLEYLKVGVPLTILSLLFGVLLLGAR